MQNVNFFKYLNVVPFYVDVAEVGERERESEGGSE